MPIINFTHEVSIVGRNFSLFMTDLYTTKHDTELWRLNVFQHRSMKKLKYDFITFISSANPESLFWFRIKYIPYDCVINRFYKCSSSFISHLHKRERIFKIDRYLDVWQKFSQRILNNSRPVVWIFYQIVWLIYCRLCIFLL